MPWPAHVAAARPRASIGDAIAFTASVLMLLVYAQPWAIFLPDQGVSDTGSAIERAMFFPMYALGLGLIATRPMAALRGLAGQPFLILLLGIAAASTAWSIAPDETSRRVVALIMTTLCGVAIGVRWRWPALVEVLATAFAVLSVVSLFLGALLPDYGRMSEIFPGAWRGLWVEKNAFGGMMTFGVLIFVTAGLLNRRRAALWWPMAALDVALLLLSTSKTSLVALVLGCAVLGFVLLTRRGERLPCWPSLRRRCRPLHASPAGGHLFRLGLLVRPARQGRDPDRPHQDLGRGDAPDRRAPLAGLRLRGDLGRDRPWGPLAWITHDAGFQRPPRAQFLAGAVAVAGRAGPGRLGRLLSCRPWSRNIVALYRSKGAYLALPFFVCSA